MDAEGVKKKEEDQTAGTPIHAVVETPQELAARLAEEEKEIQFLALTWDAEGVPGYYTAEAIKNMKEKGYMCSGYVKKAFKLYKSYMLPRGSAKVPRDPHRKYG
uniref:Uncharacterized protein n=1 Tax=Romanomermis culicivorax TaxID=13658 RepID=A0A915JMQ1_ROMCU